MHYVRDRQTDRPRTGYANSRSYCVAVRSAKTTDSELYKWSSVQLALQTCIGATNKLTIVYDNKYDSTVFSCHDILITNFLIYVKAEITSCSAASLIIILYRWLLLSNDTSTLFCVIGVTHVQETCIKKIAPETCNLHRIERGASFCNKFLVQVS